MTSKIKDSLKLFSLERGKQFFKILSKKERVIFLALVVLFFGSSIFLCFNFYFKHSEFRPTFGGTYTEGVIGQPRWINPIYSPTNDVDRDLVELIFSGLVKYNGQGEIIPDLAREYKIKEEGRVFEFYLKENLVWQDGQPLTTDDIIFTVKTVQNSDYKSPLRASWLGVQTEKISDLEIRFTLKDPYPPFLETLSLKILPQHIWEDVPPQRFPLALYNLQPVGSGSYKLTEIKQDKLGYIKSLALQTNQKYFGQKPFIPKINFLFFDNEENLIKAANQEEINGFSVFLKDPFLFENRFVPHNIVLPRYFAIFFNSKQSKILADEKIRQALNYGTDKKAILDNVFSSLGKIVHSPILPDVYGYSKPEKIYVFDSRKAKELLEKAGFRDQDGDGKREKILTKQKASAFKNQLKSGSQSAEVTELQRCLAQDPQVYPEGEVIGYFGPATKRAVIRFQEKYAQEILEPSGLKKGTGIVGPSTRSKLNEICGKTSEEILPLKFSLVTVDQPPLVQTAQLLKEQWGALGVEIEIRTVGLSQLEKDFIKKRNYESLLFGEVLGSMPDPFPFWHSSQKNDPGLNLALYENKKVDKLLEEARQSLNPEVRAQKYEQFQEILIEDAPCVFLYSPDYLYLVSKTIKGIDMEMIVDPSKRFSTIENWYIKTKRKWK